VSAVLRRAGGCLGVLLLTLTTLAGGQDGPGTAGDPAPSRHGVPAVVAATAPAATTSATTPAVTSPATSHQDPPTPPPTVLPASRPLRIEIASIGVSSELMDLGLMSDGTLEVPPGAFPAGWFTGAPTPGERGPAVIAGHIDWVTGPGVFARLGSTSVGDEIRIRRADGSVAVFRTVEVTRYPKDRFPTDLVYGDIDRAGLRVISCGGDFDTQTGHYEDNIVVFADLVA